MQWHRIHALLIRHLYLYKRSVPRIMDIFYWPVMGLLLWGFLSAHLERLQGDGFNAVAVLLGALILWYWLDQSQKAVSVAFLEDVWERNLLNLFVSPLTVPEFLASTAILGLIRVILVGIVMGILSFVLYHFNIFLLGFALLPFLINLLFFGWTLGLFTTAFVLRYGTQAQVLAFGFVFLIQPFSAVFYPVSALPVALQYVASALPATHVFEGMRAVLASDPASGALIASLLGKLILAFATNLVYAALSLWFFAVMWKRAKARGLLMKLD